MSTGLDAFLPRQLRHTNTQLQRSEFKGHNDYVFAETENGGTFENAQGAHYTAIDGPGIEEECLLDRMRNACKTKNRTKKSKSKEICDVNKALKFAVDQGQVRDR